MPWKGSLACNIASQLPLDREEALGVLRRVLEIYDTHIHRPAVDTPIIAQKSTVVQLRAVPVGVQQEVHLATEAVPIAVIEPVAGQAGKRPN
jgi:hypothetical protein